MRVRILVEDFTGRTHEIDAAPGERLVEAIFLSGHFESPALCAALGRCGQCKIRVLHAAKALAPTKTEKRLFAPQELEAGWRLSCLHHVQDGMCVFLPEQPGRRRSWRLDAAGDTGGKTLALAVDLGTTSLQWQALRGGVPVRAGTELNPQLGAGSEVMSRLAFARDPQGRARLRMLVLQRLEAIIQDLAPLGPVKRLCIAGNTAMTFILLDKDLDGLAHAPYHLDYAGGEEVKLHWESRRLPTYIPPLLAPYVGCDLSAGLSWLALGREPLPEPPFLLADLGTNAEFLLALSDTCYLVASVPMGPALEGVGLAYGNVAGPEAAVAFEMRPDGLYPVFLEPGGTGNSITGAGYISLIAQLLRIGVLTREGFFVDTPASPQAARVRNRIENSEGEHCLPLAGFTSNVRLFSSDVEEILKVKAAFNVAVACLLREGELQTADLQAVYLSGAFGAHVGVKNLEQLGFLPPGLGARTQVLGNTSLAGATLFLQRPDARTWAGRIAGCTSVVELAGKDSFNNAFVKAMAFEYRI